jgi:hypothetical protein
MPLERRRSDDPLYWRTTRPSDHLFRIPDSELVVSGNEWYTVSYVCQASADAHKSGFGYSVSYVQLHCRVPFLVVGEF